MPSFNFSQSLPLACLISVVRGTISPLFIAKLIAAPTTMDRRFRPHYDDLDHLEVDGDSLGDEMENISFGALNSAQKKLQREDAQNKSHNRHLQPSLDEEEGFFESDSDGPPEELSSGTTAERPRSKHAPSVASLKRPVSKIRAIPGLQTKSSSRFGDIRFDPAFGKANDERVRKDYSFLNEYRQSELQQMQTMLKDKKLGKTMSQYERLDLEHQAQSLRSRLDSMKNRELEAQVLADHKKQQRLKHQLGQQAAPYFLKKADKRKLLQKAKFEGMKALQREKVMERKRKRRLGREMRQLEFGQSGQK